MKKILFCLLAFITFGAKAENSFNSNGLPTKKVYAIYEDKFLRVPPPVKFLQKSGELNGCDIEVTYHDFPSEAKTAFNYAVAIWESLLTSDQPIKVDAYWIEFDGDEDANVLGAAGSSDFIIGEEGLPRNDVFYPIPLAEKLTGKNLNGTNGSEIFAYFSSNAQWYYGTDGETPAGKFDFVSVVLHELCHGLGFIGSLGVTDDNRGVWGYGSPYAYSYDQFVYNGNNQLLVNSGEFGNFSPELYNQLTSNNLFFDGPVMRAQTGRRAGLYSPSKFDSGSSIDHLSRDYDDSSNSLMTPGIRSATSIHDLGVITMAVMADVGWENIAIRHTPLANSEQIQNVNITALIAPDFDTDIIEPKLHYSINGGEMQMVDLQNSGEGNLYEKEIEITETSSLEYYISAKDKYNRVFYYPNTAPNEIIHVALGPDTVAPVLLHEPNAEFFIDEDELILLAEASDSYGIDTVYVEYDINGDSKTPLGLVKLKNNLYNVVINFSNISLQLGDTINYRIIAKDVSNANNKTVSPSSGFHALVVSKIPDYIESMVLTFDNGSNEFKMDGFKFATASGFDNPALHSEHPYKNGGANTWLDFTAEFKFPIKIHDVYHYIKFDEIALVEPGDVDDFNNSDFYDYVVVEGSNDNGKSWIPFEDGWDSRLHEEWLNAYNQSQYFNNFGILADLNLYQSHQIDLTAPTEFNVGDVVKIRFRLNSDPFATGWGWAVDNLQIQTIGLKTDYKIISGVNVYPNPVLQNEFSISGIKEPIKRLRVIDFTGRLVFELKDLESLTHISIPQKLKGIHILYLESANTVYTTKLMFE